ncbi:thiamine biosynthesis lipoprotein [Halospina denitrificans]|uniref:FAD:protein FMN transferase n=1 Tax=Halospina denitrificans TaxID=332522 RepID=A0A4R7K0H8_9GAMM|nr:FAD:protein FMN transferase [Halospina denitrificans]TDT43353.1 thiamine biosynthesis lipoprotein [Halospina denitrificans]
MSPNAATARLLSPILLILLAACSDAPPETSPTRIQGETFGTFYQVSVANDLADEQKDTLRSQLEAELDRVDRQMSTYREDSDLNRLNSAETGEWVALPDPVIELLALSRTISEATDGAFDITVGGLVNLWSFGPEARPREKPSDEALQQRLEQVGFQQLDVDQDAGRARRLSDIYADLSAIAKGHAVDRLAMLLEEAGYEAYLVNIGGDLLANGRKRSGEPWRIGIELPRDGEQVARHALPLLNMSLATSGDYRNYFEVDGQRYSHTIDPRDGRPVQHTLASVSVFHPENTMADALATAFMVMGTEDTLTYARKNEIPVLVIERSRGDFRTRISPALREMLAGEDVERLLTD